jgi:hypothetical protein
VAYAYASGDGVSYEEKLASVHPIDPDELEDYGPDCDDVREPQLLACISRLIKDGKGGGKMQLAKAAAAECKASQQAALRVLEKFKGSTPRVHLWDVKKGERGVQNYYLIEQDIPSIDQDTLSD